MDIKIGTDGDIEIENNDLVLVDGSDAVMQHLKIRFQTFLGEWFADNSVGVPWFSDVLVKNPDFVVVSEVLKSAILETTGVTDLLEFYFELSGRVATLTFKALCTDGFIDFSQEIEI